MAGLGDIRWDRRGGFTLLELLLTLVLLLALLGATVFSFSSLRRSASLDAGVDRIQTLFRFARAHAASSGRVVQVSLGVDPSGGEVPGDSAASPEAAVEVAAGGPDEAEIRVRWEADPAGRPGQFVSLPMPLPGVDELADLVRVLKVSVSPVGSTPPSDVPPGGLSLSGGTTDPGRLSVGFPGDPFADTSDAGESAVGMPPSPIRFFPDGSSDSALVTLASRDAEDRRTAMVELVGITGLSRVRWLSMDSPTGEDAGPEPVDDAAPSPLSP